MAAQSAKDKEDQHPRSITQIRKANTNVVGAMRQESGVSGDRNEDVDNGMAHPTSIHKMCPTESSLTKFDLIFTWHCGNGRNGDPKVEGQHHLTSVLVRPSSKTNGCPITVTANYPNFVAHDFEQGPAVSPYDSTFIMI